MLVKSQLEKAGIPASVHYRKADVSQVRCGTCDYFTQGKCTMFDNTPVGRGMVCDEWEGDIMKEMMGTDTTLPIPFQTPPDMTAMLNVLEPMFAVTKAQSGVKAAGVAVRALDTGRVLMLQRSNNDPKDKAAGTWEFPGGMLDDGEHPYTGAKREWQEEMGVRFPKGKHAGSWKSGVYQGFIHDVPSEESVKINLDPEDRKVKNPDPDGAEVAAWFHPHHLRRMSGLRSELRESRPWVKVAKNDWKHQVFKKLVEDDDELEKDNAPPPAGDIPADQGVDDFGGMPSKETLSAVGPTISSVHVRVPLKNISVSYAGKRKKLKVAKTDKQKQLIYGVVLEPNVMDSQEDFMLPEHVEQAAHTYMKKVVRGKASVSKLQHRKQGFFKEKASVVPVQSFIAPTDFSYDGKETVRKGTWVMCLHIEDSNVWQDVMDGKYTGLSIGGSGIRQELNLPVPGEWMTTEPSDWFKKEADARYRDYSWEGS